MKCDGYRKLITMVTLVILFVIYPKQTLKGITDGIFPLHFKVEELAEQFQRNILSLFSSDDP